MRKISKLLVANRGEIALRVMRTAKEMGIQTVAIYSEADRMSPHVRFADEAVLMGPPPSNQSYLLADKIISICKELGVDAVHPGYGFLSENATFARKLEENNILLVGPTAHSMDIMGNKLSAKQAVLAFHIPMVPGLETAITDVEFAKRRAVEIGFPILIKAAAGGGGKGMRVVEKLEEFEEQMQLAISEATNSFGDGSVFIEKYVGSPKHIEIQIMADKHGNVVYLFERNCSIQRRHQKVVEEAPSSILTPEKRKAMGEAAVRVAKACDYYGAGTVEFLVDEDLNFYFLEMNTRLQVEHPVTEMITGIDLVREQIRVAEGHPLSFTQESLVIHGHSIELRVCAEDPCNNFLPDIGKLETYQRPQGPGIRVDDGFDEGMEIPIYYDPMIAKLIVHAGTREEAIQRMIRAIDDYKITGFANTLEFGKWVMNHPDFHSGDFDTHFIQHHFKPEYLDAANKEEQEIAALFASFIHDQHVSEPTMAQNQSAKSSEWRRNRVM
jgi:acetyl-CoA carboxylase biotin carboxylase subunit